MFYAGTAEEWKKVKMDGRQFRSDAMHYYSEEPVTEGNYWHYVDGVPTIWEIAE